MYPPPFVRSITKELQIMYSYLPDLDFFKKAIGKSKQMCYDIQEVNIMEQGYEQDMPMQEPEYAPRPRWQIWAARIGLAAFLIMLVFYYLNISRGGF